MVTDSMAATVLWLAARRGKLATLSITTLLSLSLHPGQLLEEAPVTLDKAGSECPFLLIFLLLLVCGSGGRPQRQSIAHHTEPTNYLFFCQDPICFCQGCLLLWVTYQSFLQVY